MCHTYITDSNVKNSTLHLAITGDFNYLLSVTTQFVVEFRANSYTRGLIAIQGAERDAQYRGGRKRKGKLGPPRPTFGESSKLERNSITF